MALKPQVSDLGHIGDAAPTVTYRTAPAQNPWAKKPYRGVLPAQQAGYANMSRWGIDEIPRGPSALFVDYADPLHPVVSKGHPPSDVRWEYASPAQYRAYAKIAAAQKAKAAKAAKTAAPAAGATAAGAGQAGAAPAAGAVPGSTVPGSTATGAPPDYQSYLNVDPILAATMRNLQGQDILGQSTLVGGAQQLYGRLGEMPTNLSPELAALLGPEQRAALEGAIRAGANPTPDNPLGAGTSALARLQHDYGQGQTAIGSAYAAHGGRSGGYGVHQNELLHDYTVGQYDTRLAATDALKALQNTYLTGQQERAGQQVTALTSAQERAGNLIGQGYGLPVTNPYMPPKTAAPTTPGVAPAAPKPPALPKPAAPFPRAGQVAARSL